jgi:hypothetical protein
MKLNRRGVLGLAAAALAVIGGGTAFAAVSANPPGTVTAVTHIQNDPDSGHAGIWAIDQITRTTTVTRDPAHDVPGFLAYTASASDAGTFTTRPGALTPNQSVPGQVIAHVVSGTMTGAADYAVLAPTGDALGSTFQSALNDNSLAPAPGSPESVGGWPLQGFTPASGVLVTLKDWGWTYATPAGEDWVDSSAVGNGDGNLVQDGNITGLLAPPPVVIRLSHGHGTATAPTRETVSYQQSGAASWDKFYIVGPGAINGHAGWVNGKLGLNFGYYWGLKAGHGYTVFYTPVEGQGSNVQVPGSRAGYVYFVS